MAMRRDSRTVLSCTLVFIGSVAGAPGAPDADTGAASRPAQDGNRPNVLLITADDLNYDSLGCTGSRVPDITPNIDRLAASGVRFVHAHVTVAVCQPSRSVLMTGRYPHRNGAQGFEPIRGDVPTLQESLRAAGYMNGIFAKVGHLAPQNKFCWDVVVDAAQLAAGRDPALYYRHAKDFFEKARSSGKPFFLMANSQDPHRPFVGAEKGPARRARDAGDAAVSGPGPKRVYTPDEIQVPGFLPDLPDVRTDVARYFTSVRRCDETVGQLLRALKETGLEDNTIVMFLSDNGMSFPFAKTNCYLAGTRTPWLVRWPGKTRPGTVDREHMISGIDFMPTILEACGLPPVAGMDGRSFLPLLRGEQQDGRDRVYTVFHETAGKKVYPMRSVLTRKYGYIFNAWSDGRTVFRNEAQNGLAFRGMTKAAESRPDVAARVRLFLYRVPEELYDYENDPCALNNLAADPKYKDELERLRGDMRKIMEATGDPLLSAFKERVAAARETRD